MDYEEVYERLREVRSLWEQHEEEYLEFERVANKRSRRPDLHAFLVLDELSPGDNDMLSGAEHDNIYLEVDPEDIIEHLTEDLIIELIRCGVRLDEHGFSMFV